MKAGMEDFGVTCNPSRRRTSSLNVRFSIFLCKYLSSNNEDFCLDDCTAHSHRVKATGKHFMMIQSIINYLTTVNLIFTCFGKL